MLRVTVATDEQGPVMRLEGRLAGPALVEVEHCWQCALAEHPEQAPRVDLRAVTFIDEKGKSFLKHAFLQGARFLSAGCLTRAYVEEIRCAGDAPPEKGEKRNWS